MAGLFGFLGNLIVRLCFLTELTEFTESSRRFILRTLRLLQETFSF
jgi:hypothetical protein